MAPGFRSEGQTASAKTIQNTCSRMALPNCFRVMSIEHVSLVEMVASFSWQRFVGDG